MQEKSVGLMPKASKEKRKSDNKDQIEVAEKFLEVVKDNQLEEFMIVGLEKNGQILISSYCDDYVVAMGLLELGKIALLQKPAEEVE